jgi:nucleoid-associated protein YgaU
MGLEKLTITPQKGESVEAMYNPSEISIETRNQFQRTAMPGLPTPVTQFVSGDTQKISLNLFFDTYEQREDVRDHTSKVLQLLKIDPSLHAPPVCKFIWGGKPLSGFNDKLEFKGVFDSISQKFTMFHEDGYPVRATLTCSISEYQTIEEQLKSLGLESADRTKRKVFKEGDSLWHLAFTEYGDPAHWRVIAEKNKIDDPRMIAPGTELIIPPME